MNKRQIHWHLSHSYTALSPCLFTYTQPTKVSLPQIVLFNHQLNKELGLNLQVLPETALSQLLSGNCLPPEIKPISQAYAGHQFGQFTILGDGRAHLLGELLTPSGNLVDIALKGSGQTPYSRQGDGRAALEPMLREYLLSEAMHALGIPSSRSLAVVTTGDMVYREKPLAGAVLTRIAASHIRVGTFQYALAKCDKDSLQQLADYTIARHYPSLQNEKHPYLALLQQVIQRQIHLIIHWMRVGFIHGIMNTDNMTLSGETIDFGPCAFLDSYEPQAVFSFIDTLGRYAFNNQPVIAQWNLARLAETLVPLLHSDPNQAILMAAELIEQIPSQYESQWLNMMRTKLGWFGEQKNDKSLIMQLLHWMQTNQADYTNTFLALSEHETMKETLYQDAAFQHWHQLWQKRQQENNQPLQASLDLMRAHNPAIIPRNHQVEQVLKDASAGDIKPLKQFLHALTKPYQNHSSLKPYQLPPTPNQRICHTYCGT